MISELKRKLLIVIATLTSSLVLSPLVYANAETDAKAACERYGQAAQTLKTDSNQQSMTFICENNEHNANEWNCMYEKQINQHWTSDEASGTCLKTAPALAYYTQKGGEAVANNEPRVYCESAMAKFPQASYTQHVCNLSSRTAIEWYCMLNFANDGDSFIYASGQCFDNKKR